MGYLTDKERIRTIDTRRVIYFVVTVLFFFITELGRNVYRPYIYSNGIDDFGLADSIGNLGGIVVQIYFSLTILNVKKNRGLFVIGFIVIGYILYEILQPYLPRGVFDWKDIYGTILGGVLSLLIWVIINLVVRDKVIYKFR